MTTAEDVQRELKENFDLVQMKTEADASAQEELGPLANIGAFAGMLWKLYQVGEWVTWRMLKDGATVEETEEQSFVIGQRSMGNDPFQVAAAVYDNWKAGRAEKPGRELAEKITEEIFGPTTRNT